MLNVIILAAGKGTRMKSDLVKVAHEVAGKALVNYVVDTVFELGEVSIFLVVGHQADVIQRLTSHVPVSYVLQQEQLGTGHAVLQVLPHLDLEEDSATLVLAGDCPLIELETLRELLGLHRSAHASTTILTTVMPDPGTYGRILRDSRGAVMGIQEAKDCSFEQLKIEEINTGVYCFQTKALFSALKRVTPQNTQKEYYLTDVIHLLKKDGHIVSGLCTPKAYQAIGVNTRMDLADISEKVYQKTNRRLMEAGVTLVDPRSTFIEETVVIGPDTVIHPFCTLSGHAFIGKGCTLGSHGVFRDSKIIDNTVVPPFYRD